MKLLYSGLRWDYGKKQQGDSYEYWNFQAGLEDYSNKRGHELDIYHPDETIDLLDNYIAGALSCKYDCIINFAFNESLDLPASLVKIASKNDIPILEWQSDTSWRYENFVKPRKDRVSYFITTHPRTVDWFKRDHINVILSQWAGSPKYLSNDCADFTYDMTFIGQKHGHLPNGGFVRSQIVNAIQDAGIKLHLFGNYWEGHRNWHGYLQDFARVPAVMSQSKICLNISNPWHTIK